MFLSRASVAIGSGVMVALVASIGCSDKVPSPPAAYAGAGGTATGGGGSTAQSGGASGGGGAGYGGAGGTAFGGAGSTAQSGGASGGAGDVSGSRSADCPAVEPSGGPCPKISDPSGVLVCEYGDNYNPTCNRVYLCNTLSAEWHLHWGGPLFGQQPSFQCNAPFNRTNSLECPADSTSSGSGCDSGASCDYDATVACLCRNPCPQSYCDAGQEWICETQAPYCATPRPRVGSPCQQGSASCRLEDPDDFHCGGLGLDCYLGVWTLHRPMSCY
jgi:hypothetical protein